MKFNTTQPIFVQIGYSIEEKILKKELLVDQQIPSVRDLAVTLEVNPNTIQRAYERLQSNGIIYNKRGLGFYVVADAMENIRNNRKKRFVESSLPEMFQEMELLDISLKEITDLYNDFKNKKS